MSGYFNLSHFMPSCARLGNVLSRLDMLGQERPG